MDEIEVSGRELGHALGISERQVRDLATRDLVVRGDRGKYRFVASVQKYAGHLREVAAGRGGDAGVTALSTERARLAKEQADAVALKNSAARKELVPAQEVLKAWSEILRRVRNGLLAVPSRARQQLPHLTAHDVALIDQEVRQTLAELSGYAAIPDGGALPRGDEEPGTPS